MGKKVIFFLSKEETLAKALFYLFIAALLSFVIVSTTSISVVQEGWGYNAPIAPSVNQTTGAPAIAINNGAEMTDSVQVMLSFSVKDAAEMAISHTSNFSAVSLEPYSATRAWTLPEGEGQKEVFVRFVSSAGGSLTASDSIQLVSSVPVTTEVPTSTADPAPTPAPAPAPEQGPEVPTTVEACALEKEKAHQVRGQKAVWYITTSCTKRAFTSGAIYASYFENYDVIVHVTAAELARVANDTLGFMPWGPRRAYRNGDILKTVDDAKVYIVVHNKKNWITSEETFLALYGSWSMVEDVDPRVIANFENGEEITDTEFYPDGSLVKTDGDAKVYLVDGGRLRWITSEEVFNAFNYRWDRIFTITNFDSYDLGPDVR